MCVCVHTENAFVSDKSLPKVNDAGRDSIPQSSVHHSNAQQTELPY
jgi:hypothetical protein